MIEVVEGRYDQDDEKYGNVDHYMVYENGKLIAEYDNDEFHVARESLLYLV